MGQAIRSALQHQPVRGRLRPWRKRCGYCGLPWPCFPAVDPAHRAIGVAVVQRRATQRFRAPLLTQGQAWRANSDRRWRA